MSRGKQGPSTPQTDPEEPVSEAYQLLVRAAERRLEAEMSRGVDLGPEPTAEELAALEAELDAEARPDVPANQAAFKRRRARERRKREEETLERSIRSWDDAPTRGKGPGRLFNDGIANPTLYCDECDWSLNVRLSREVITRLTNHVRAEHGRQPTRQERTPR